VPEHGELPKHVDGGHEDICAVAKEGKEEGGSQPMTEEGGEADSWRGETFDSHEGRLGLSQSLDKMGGSRDRGGEPVAQPPYLTLWREDRPI